MPLWPLPDVLPVPEPGPRPRRFRSRFEPGAGDRLWRPIFSVATVLFLDALHLDEVAHLLELSTQRRGILLDHLGLMVSEPDRLQRELHRLAVPDAAPDLLDPDLARGQLVLARRLRPLARVPNECPWHVTPPPSTWRATGSRAWTGPRRARARSGPPSSAGRARPSPRAPCCAGSS